MQSTVMGLKHIPEHKVLDSDGRCMEIGTQAMAVYLTGPIICASKINNENG